MRWRYIQYNAGIHSRILLTYLRSCQIICIFLHSRTTSHLPYPFYSSPLPSPIHGHYLNKSYISVMMHSISRTNHFPFSCFSSPLGLRPAIWCWIVDGDKPYVMSALSEVISGYFTHFLLHCYFSCWVYYILLLHCVCCPVYQFQFSLKGEIASPI